MHLFRGWKSAAAAPSAGADAASVGADAAAAAGAEAQTAEVEVTVLTLAGEPLVVVNLPSSSTVLDLKQAIATRCGHLVEVQQLTYKESALNDSKQTLTECGLEGNVALTLLVKGIDVDLHIERLRAKGRMTEAEDVKLLCAMAENIFLKEPSLLLGRFRVQGLGFRVWGLGFRV